MPQPEGQRGRSGRRAREATRGGEISGELEFVRSVAEEAGEIIREAWGRCGTIEEKGSNRDLVTEIDRRAERAILGRLGERFPEDMLWGEESGGPGGFDPQSECFWLVDPLDGTVNFTYEHPFVAVSIARIEAGRPTLGVVHAPILHETFLAERGGGAFRNGRKIRVSSRSPLSEALLATGFACLREPTKGDNLANFARLARRARGVRRCGSAAIDLAYVACGRYDGFWEFSLAPYDVAAGSLLVEEAGGRITDILGGDGSLFGSNIVASNDSIHEAILELLDPLPSSPASN